MYLWEEIKIMVNLDDKASEDFKTTHNSAIGWIVISSYAYYHLNESIISDSLFDYLCSVTLDEWDDLKHLCKHLISKEDMKAGSCYALKLEDYPYGLIRCVNQLLIELEERRKK